jgi:3-hydroxybutyryl-CoA dehydrogenase
MSEQELRNVVVLGAGVLGSQIGWHSAYKGKTVVIYDPFPDGLARGQSAVERYAEIYRIDLDASDDAIAATRERLTFSSDLKAAVAEADLVIEAVPEEPEIKNKVYLEMAPLLPGHTIIATNSSTLLARDFAEVTGRPQKFCALHFANMIWALNIVEIMAHPGTARDTLIAITKFSIEIGQVLLPVRKEQNGYILNSWLSPLLNAAISLVVNGVATPEDVDRSFLIANRGCQLGPFGIMDMVGMRTCYNVADHWGTINNESQMVANAAFLKSEMLEKGRLGMESGEGFYSYPNPKFARPGFLDVPSMDSVPEIVELATLR